MKLKLIISFLFIFSTMFPNNLKEGVYRGVLILNEETKLELPFIFEVIYKNKIPCIIIKNGIERINIDEIKIDGDSVNFKMPIFNTEFKTALVGNNLEGFWINNNKNINNKLKFKATFGEKSRFLTPLISGASIFEAKWEVTFSPNTKDSSKAIGVFNHLEQTNQVTGTFLTETGDYRYLEGVQIGNQLTLSAFDGSHAYLFIVEKNGDQLINGKFFSGDSYQEEWIAKKNAEFNLTNPNEITFLKNKTDKINFEFPNLSKNKISLLDKKFINKPIIIQVMGSWCPNCMDESVYLSDLYNRFQKNGLEIIALAFEKTDDFDKAKNQLLRFKKRLRIEYDILITQKIGKAHASEVLSALNKISAFPTTIFLNKAHQVVKVHTGFNGPATEMLFENFKTETEILILKLLNE